MKRLFIKFTAYFSLLAAAIFIPVTVVQSCGPMLSADESRFSLFRTGLDKESGLSPFYYAELPFNATEADPAKLDYKHNCKEWLSFCGSEVREKDIYNVQYKISADSFLVAYSKQKLDQFKDNSFIKWLLKKDNHAALEYIALAKESESTQYKNAGDPWDTAVDNSSQCEAIALKAAKALGLSLPPFLKERYAFQAIKMFYYSGSDKGHTAELNQLYETQLLQSKSIVAGWALVYYGMSQANTEKRTALLLQAFDKTEEKKEFCYSRVSAGNLAALEKTTDDKNLLLLINTLKSIKSRGKTLDQIRSIYQIDPTSKYLPLVITREINKLENWIWSPEQLYFPDNYRPETADITDRSKTFMDRLKDKDIQYLEEVKTFVKKMADENKAHSNFLQLALVHLYNMQQNFTAAQNTLEKIGVLSDPSLETQRLIEATIATAQAQDITMPATQQRLAELIQKLIVLNPRFKKQIDRAKYNIWEHEGESEKDDDLSELFVLLSHCFEKKGNKVMAGLVYNKANITVNNYDGYSEDGSGYRNIAWFDRYATSEDMDSLLAFKHKNNKTVFEQLASPKIWGLDDQYRDLKGTILFRQKKYKEALQVFQTMKPDFWLLHYEYKNYLPATSVTNTGAMIPSETLKPAKYSMPGKMLIVKDIVTLQDAIAEEKSKAKKAFLCYQLANAYFNTSYNGKAWMVFSYGKSANESYERGTGNYNWASFDFYPNNFKYADYYYGCSDAVNMYKTALSLTTDKELAAKCLLSLAVCAEIRTGDLSRVYQKKWKGNSSEYLQKLKANYSNTRAFQDAAVECPLLKDYQ